MVEDHGRQPLLTTSKGRITKATFRRDVYQATAPCFRGETCAGHTEPAGTRCEGSVSPHSIRRGSITHHLTNDIPTEVVSDRMTVSRKILEKHYDRRSDAVKLEQRRGYLENF